MASILILFKHRHHLSIECMADLLSLLLLLEVENVPRSWHQLKQQISAIKPKRSYFTPCENCCLPSTNASKCTNCGQLIRRALYEKTFINFSIKDQLEIILYNNDISLLFSSYTSNVMTDIKDGHVYQQLKTLCHDKFLTLTLNIDGVEVKKKSNKSIWPALLVINEIPLDQRYNLENVIIAGVWIAPNKPSRKEMKCFLSPVVEELSEMENGYIFNDCRKSPNHQNMIKLFLIGSCCDKPAQALVQNLPEPIARFGCGRCEVPGKKAMNVVPVTFKYKTKTNLYFY
jgi:hypothetical protein